MVRILLSDTKLVVRIPGFEGEDESFQINRGSPQGDSLSDPLFTVYFERALQNVRDEIEHTPPEEDHPYTTFINTRIDMPQVECDHSYQSIPGVKEPPPEITFADDKDHLTTNEDVQAKFLNVVSEILESFGLLFNNGKTEKQF